MTPEEIQDIAEFKKRLRGIPGHKVITALNFLNHGVDFTGCSKEMMAESWAARGDRRFGHSSLAHITLDMIITKIEEVYPGGKSTMGPTPPPSNPLPPRVRILDVRERIEAVRKKVNAEIAAGIDRSSKFSSGLAYEGYQGGYLDCLNDVTLLLNGVEPSRRNYWN